MSARLAQVLDHLESRLRTSHQDDPTGNGLLVCGREQITTIGAALNTSFVAIDAAIRANVDLLFVHHAPWAGIELGREESKLARLRDAGISLYAAHEGLDRALIGSVGAVLAQQVALSIERQGSSDLVVCTAPPMTFASWTALVADRLAAPVRAWPNHARFERVAVVPGGGGHTRILG